MLSWGRESRDLLLFFTHHYDITTLLVNARQLDQGRAAKQVLQASTLSWAFISPQLSSFVTKCEQRKLTNSILFLCYEMRTEKTPQPHRRRIVVWWKGAPLRLRLYKTRSPPFCRLAGPLGEFRGALRSASDESILAKQSLTTP